MTINSGERDLDAEARALLGATNAPTDAEMSALGKDVRGGDLNMAETDATFRNFFNTLETTGVEKPADQVADYNLDEVA